jgi:hypothetical protein
MGTKRRRGAPIFRQALIAFSLLLLTATASADLCVGADVARAMPPSAALLARAEHDQTLAARLKAFSRHARERGVDKPGRGRGVSAGHGALPTPLAPAAPTVSQLPTLALLVDFRDRRHAVDAAAFDGLLFADVFGPQSVRATSARSRTARRRRAASSMW